RLCLPAQAPRLVVSVAGNNPRLYVSRYSATTHAVKTLRGSLPDCPRLPRTLLERCHPPNRTSESVGAEHRRKWHLRKATRSLRSPCHPFQKPPRRVPHLIRPHLSRCAASEKFVA